MHYQAREPRSVGPTRTIGVRRGRGSGVISGSVCGRSVAVGATLGGGAQKGSGVTGVRGTGAGSSISSVRDTPSYVTSAPSPRATAASGIIGSPERRYGAMGNDSGTPRQEATSDPS